ncbi:unnamed protein product [Schistocephalus solidus]|uniref:Ig-like domain-containing protein n=1 Tax=Schistocephalus solidus TaxID=70667 RepID=A0A3P7CI90_SCHSO|nr:unnamed protein product [Schistocephalus solidus]
MIQPNDQWDGVCRPNARTHPDAGLFAHSSPARCNPSERAPDKYFAYTDCSGSIGCCLTVATTYRRASLSLRVLDMSAVMASAQPFGELRAPAGGAPPRFLTQLESDITVPEGEPIHLDIRVASDSEVQLDWLKDGKKLMTGSRINEAFDRGYASLDILYTIPEDTGMYSCVVRNLVDSATANAVQISGISILNRAGKIIARIHLSGLNDHLEHGLLSESPCGSQGPHDTTDVTFVVCQLREKFQEMWAHLYTNLADLAKAFNAANRDGFRKILQKYGCPEVIPEEAEQYTTVSMQNEAYDELSRREHETEQEVQSVAAPSFARDIYCAQPSVAEGQRVRITGEITPYDGSLRVDWLKDGQPIVIGSRFSSFMDRGVVILDIAYCIPEDSGSYVCVATNKSGRCESSSVGISCEADARIVTKSNLTENSISHLKKLEEPGDEFSHAAERIVDPIPPSFKGPIIPPSVTTPETFDAYFEVPVDTGNGSKVTVEWKKDGEMGGSHDLNSFENDSCSRITVKLEMGVASLRFNYTQPSDTGNYVCCITTEHGRAESDAATLSIEKTGTIINDSQLTGLQALKELEDLLNAPRRGPDVEDGPAAAPSILRQPKPVGEIMEGESVSFQLQFEPATDPNVTVEWYKDGESLCNGTRFRVEHERGIATLGLLHTIPEDSGSYWCQITNASGSIESEHLQLTCNPSAAIITQSNLLEGSEGFKLIQAIEAAARESSDTSMRYAEEVPQDAPPAIDVPPQAMEVIVGAPARFLVKMSGYPVPEIAWLVDGEPVQQDSLTKVYSDGGISILEFNKCTFELGSHTIQVRAHNGLGNTEAQTELVVHPTDYKVPDLKHVAPENPFRKLMALKKVECTPELNKAFSKSKPTPETIIMMERGTEMKVKNFRSPEVVAAEEMLDKITHGLRKSEINKVRPVSTYLFRT